MKRKQGTGCYRVDELVLKEIGRCEALKGKERKGDKSEKCARET